MESRRILCEKKLCWNAAKKFYVSNKHRRENFLHFSKTKHWLFNTMLRGESAKKRHKFGQRKIFQYFIYVQLSLNRLGGVETSDDVLLVREFWCGLLLRLNSSFIFKFRARPHSPSSSNGILLASYVERICTRCTSCSRQTTGWLNGHDRNGCSCWLIMRTF